MSRLLALVTLLTAAALAAHTLGAFSMSTPSAETQQTMRRNALRHAVHIEDKMFRLKNELTEARFLLLRLSGLDAEMARLVAGDAMATARSIAPHLDALIAALGPDPIASQTLPGETTS